MICKVLEPTEPPYVDFVSGYHYTISSIELYACFHWNSLSKTKCFTFALFGKYFLCNTWNSRQFVFQSFITRKGFFSTIYHLPTSLFTGPKWNSVSRNGNTWLDCKIAPILFSCIAKSCLPYKTATLCLTHDQGESEKSVLSAFKWPYLSFHSDFEEWELVNSDAVKTAFEGALWIPIAQVERKCHCSTITATIFTSLRNLKSQ